jgi:excisionase family DNA binding protein
MNKHSPSGKRRKKVPAAQAYYSETAFAQHLGVSRVTIWRWMREGKLRYVRLGPSLVRIPITEIERLGRQHVDKRLPFHPGHCEPAE